MEPSPVALRAVIFDIYNTLLEVGPPPAEAEVRWALLWQAKLKREPRLSLAACTAECQQAIARQHATAHLLGIRYPEVYWPAVVRVVLPELAALPEAERYEFRFHHAQLTHSVRLTPEAAEGLRLLARARVRLGLASNAQPYTVRELETSLAGGGLSADLFHPALRFFSYEHGFSKPDPHVFQLLTARLGALGIAPEETLMVGDRLDNDIVPARAFGWQTWQMALNGGPGDGNWTQLAYYLAANIAPAPAANGATLG
jgi:putative hydrolase of the HAD superfamily